MARVIKESIVTSIDVGTTKICVLIAKKIGDQLDILGVGKSPSHGLHKGVVVDVAKTIKSITQAVKEAEMMAGVQVESAYIGISGGHISSVNSSGVVPVKHGIIRSCDVKNVLDAAQAIQLIQGQQILHVLPQYFIINGNEQVLDPIGMHGVRLEVNAHVITGSTSSVQNLINCCQGAGISVTDIILEQLASADAVLSEDERELGVAMLDIGGGTSDLAIYQHGSVRHTSVLPVAGNHVTNDIAIGLRITKEEAERIKKEYGMSEQSDNLIEVEMVHGGDFQIIKHQDLIEIIEPRMQELFNLVNDEIHTHQLLSFIPTGLVLTGGGSLLSGAKELAEKIFDCPVRIGKPRVFFDLPDTLQSPLYATGYGLLIHVMQSNQKNGIYRNNEPLVQRVLERMKSWVLDFM